MISLPRLTALARERLPHEVAEKFCTRLRPHGELLSTAPAGAETVGVLGGEPSLPDGVDWPVWEDHGPLSFIASLDCAALSWEHNDLLPDSGTLLFFYFDGQVDEHSSWVHPDDPDTAPGARVLYVPEETPVTPRSTPSPLEPYRRVPLQAEFGVEVPQLDDSWVHGPLGLDHDTVSNDPVYVDFQEAMWDLRQTSHQVGGIPDSIQGDVALEVSDVDPHDADNVDPDDFDAMEDIENEVSQWQLLAQFASSEEAGMMWGDGGNLYWLITSSDAELCDFGEARFTWQSH